MGKSRDTESSQVLEASCAARDDTQDLLLALKDLLNRLSGRHEGDPDAASEDVERWEDGDYLYFEAGLKDSEDAEIDVCIQGGRAFLRVAR